MAAGLRSLSNSMSDDRRYKQRGYQESDNRSSPQSQGFSPGGKRLPVITQYKETVRCAECGHDLGTLFDIREGSACPRCGADLHTCRNCKHFDTGSRFECTQTIKERVQKKGKANSCAPFTPRAIVVKELNQAAQAPSASGPSAPSQTVRPDEARAALEKLFKK
jgi:hypothetical protein